MNNHTLTEQATTFQNFQNITKRKYINQNEKIKQLKEMSYKHKEEIQHLNVRVPTLEKYFTHIKVRKCVNCIIGYIFKYHYEQIEVVYDNHKNIEKIIIHTDINDRMKKEEANRIINLLNELKI